MSVCGEIEIAEHEIRQAQEKIRALQDELDKQAEIIRLAYERKTMLEEVKQYGISNVDPGDSLFTATIQCSIYGYHRDRHQRDRHNRYLDNLDTNNTFYLCNEETKKMTKETKAIPDLTAGDE